MRWLRSLRGRVVLAVLASLVAGVTLQNVVAVRMVAVQGSLRFAEVFDPIAADVLAACVEAPGAWHPQGAEWEAFAYDGTTFRSPHPEAPPLHWLLRVPLAWGEAEAGRVGLAPWGGEVAWRTGLTPPCDLVLVRWRIDEARRLNLSVAALFSWLLVGLAASAIAALLAIRPLARRLDALARSARAVGTPAFASDDEGDDDLGVLARTLREAHGRVLAEQEAERGRTTILESHLADIAHDLRTPLASLQLRLEALASDTPAVEPAIGDVVYLGLLTENLHLASQLRDVDDRPAAEPIDLGAVVDRVVARFRVLGARRHVVVDGGRPDEPVWSRVEAVHAEQALANLVHNAVAHHDGGLPGHDGAHVAVTLTRRGDTFTLTVADDGPGVAPADLPRLTERTFRSDAARARDGRGDGLGLAIVAAVCARVGWTVDVSLGTPRGLVVRLVGTVSEAPAGA